jgi:hypothetical protein
MPSCDLSVTIFWRRLRHLLPEGRTIHKIHFTWPTCPLDSWERATNAFAAPLNSIVDSHLRLVAYLFIPSLRDDSFRAKHLASVKEKLTTLT